MSEVSASHAQKQYRRVVIDLEIEGTPKQADAVRDAIGLATDDDYIAGIITPLLKSEEIERANWKVRGEKWVPA